MTKYDKRDRSAGLSSSHHVPRLPAASIILLVEDEEPARALMVRVLERAGATVYVAGSAAEAQRVAAELPRIDLLITDVVLPDIPGVQLLSMLRRWRSTLRVLFISGYLPEQIAPEGTPFLPKPFQPRDLIDRVADILAEPTRES